MFASALVRDSRAPIPKILPCICFTYSHPSLTVKGLRTAQLALFVLIHQLITSHQHLNRIPGILRVGIVMGAGTVAGTGAGASIGMFIEAVYKHQVEVYIATPK